MARLPRHRRVKMHTYAWPENCVVNCHGHGHGHPTTLDPRGNLEGWRALRFDPYLRKSIPNFTGPWGDKDVRKIVDVQPYSIATRSLGFGIAKTPGSAVPLLFEQALLQARADGEARVFFYFAR